MKHLKRQTLLTAYGCLLRSIAKPADEATEQLVDAAYTLSGMNCTDAERAFLPLKPVFSRMNGFHDGYFIPSSSMPGTVPLPGTKPASQAEYISAYRELTSALTEKGFINGKISEEGLDELIGIMEDYASTLPAMYCNKDSSDISLYDCAKLSAAAGCCISEYLLSEKKSIADTDIEALRNTPAFLLYSADISGIQSFIYTVADSKALRSLRSRSFFLELIAEHYADELLTGCGLSRLNLIYSGGGHCYILLPNTDTAVRTAERVNSAFNDFLLDEFGISLFIAHGMTSCSANELLNIHAENMPYKEIFRKVSSAVSSHKLHRYSAKQIMRINDTSAGGERECKVCGRSDRLTGDLCPWCSCFEKLSEKIQKRTVYYVSGNGNGYDFMLPSINSDSGNAYFSFIDEKEARIRESSDEDILRIYIKNKSCGGFRHSTNIYVGDYSYDNLMETLAGEADGITRIGVCRMDVDNLGQAFVSGFEDKSTDIPVRRYRNVALHRTASFSRQMTLFFKRYINHILSGYENGQGSLAVSVVYSGGDDVFLVGAWNDVIEASDRIQSAFEKYTCGALTISGGIAVFDEHYPIRAAAYETAELEDRSKKEDGKNSVSLFEASGKHTYKWKLFREAILDEKLPLMTNFFNDDNERGNAFLYRLLSLLRGSYESEGRINLARYAYLLSRLQPSARDPGYEKYRNFADKMYEWAIDKTARGQLITAIYIYVYLNRGK